MTNLDNTNVKDLSLKDLADTPAGGYDTLLGCLMLACRCRREHPCDAPRR